MRTMKEKQSKQDIHISKRYSEESREENNEEVVRNQVIDDIFQLELKDILKDVSNEKEINGTIEFINDKINILKNFINKMAEEKYEYFYKYIDKMSNAKKTKKWNSYNLENIGKKYKSNYEFLREKKNKVLSLISEKRCLIEIEKILKLYEIVDLDIKKLYYEMRDSKVFDVFHSCEGKETDMIDLASINKERLDIPDMRINNNKSGSSSGIYTRLLMTPDFDILEKYLSRLNNTKSFIRHHNIENISIVALKVKRMKTYENYIISVFIQYLSGNFFKDTNFEKKVKQCMNAFRNLNIEKECLKKIIDYKIREANPYILNIKNGRENGRKDFFTILQNCKNGIDQISYLNEIIKENYDMEEEIRKEKDKEEKKGDNNNKNASNSSEEDRKKCNDVHIYTEFYLPYINLLINNQVNKLIKKEDILYVLNLIGEFLHIIHSKNDFFKGYEKDILFNLFNREYEEITFTSMNKLIYLVELLFQKTSIGNSMDYENDCNFPSIFDIKNYVEIFFKELIMHIYYPYIFRKIIVSCNNSLLLLSNNLNNLKQNINVHIEIDIKNKYITLDYVHKKLKYNLELFIISRQLLRYLIYSLAKLKRKIMESKISTYKMINVLSCKENYEVANLFNDNFQGIEEGILGIGNYSSSDNTIGKELITLSFDESFEEFFHYQDHLNNYFGDNLLCLDNDSSNEFIQLETCEEKKSQKKEYVQGNKSIEKKEHKEQIDISPQGDEQPNDSCSKERGKEEETSKYDNKNVADFKISLFSDVKHNSFHLNDSYNICDDHDNYEITPFFIKDKNKKNKKNYFDLTELEKGICELNNVVNSCIYECFESFEKKSIWYFKNNHNTLGTHDVHLLFDQLCTYFNTRIIQCIPIYECTQMISNLINRILIYLIALSCYHLINEMDVYLFKYYESLQKITNSTTPICLNFGWKLCTLFKKSIDIKNGKVAYEDVPPFFVPIMLVIFHGGKTIVDSLSITEDKFINLLIDHLRNPVQAMDGKGSNIQNLNFVVNKFAKSMFRKNEHFTAVH
ncbi:hypothetical protein, conserved [Plasmodium gonderi]|uniref:Uncharacterized protein n=1 Tax=Plasmodium gonderi TaxID=77519 RepID=A0A1Y1JGI1_PLAGO|nr:hypothetical protein, conserved [Plasmodium gonderi]GAW81626.1 hypothetical protein, conserved [Plasmodium gonderi]